MQWELAEIATSWCTSYDLDLQGIILKFEYLENGES